MQLRTSPPRSHLKEVTRPDDTPLWKYAPPPLRTSEEPRRHITNAMSRPGHGICKRESNRLIDSDALEILNDMLQPWQFELFTATLCQRCLRSFEKRTKTE